MIDECQHGLFAYCPHGCRLAYLEEWRRTQVAEPVVSIVALQRRHQEAQMNRAQEVDHE